MYVPLYCMYVFGWSTYLGTCTCYDCNIVREVLLAEKYLPSKYLLGFYVDARVLYLTETYLNCAFKKKGSY